MLLLLACTGAPSDPPADPKTRTEPVAHCGDGTVNADELCDDGAANSDTTPDACRSDCFPATCGDGVVDAGEACDSGDTWGGDGCDPTCAIEAGAPESEPNDTWDAANTGAAAISGALSAADTDCFTLDVPNCGALSVQETAPCLGSLLLTAHDPDGAGLAAGGPGADGCATLDPAEEPGARWVGGGTWSVCVSATNDAEVRGYTLTMSTPDPLTLGAAPVGSDLDGDATPDSCDTDLDGDGLDNDADNCPEVSNGPDTPAFSLDTSGFVIGWLAAGPFTTGTSTGDCRPSDDALVGEDGALAPSAGDAAGTLTWDIELPGTADFNLLTPFGTVEAPREAYTLVYVRSDEARSLTLAVGADDGVFAWWNGTQVLDVSGCQGITFDQFQAPVEVLASWNTLLLKVRDAGGGWDLSARLLDADGAAVTDLEVSLAPDGEWEADQTDSDGDGLGDVCD